MRSVPALLTGALMLLAACGGDQAADEGQAAGEPAEATAEEAAQESPDLSTVALPEGVTMEMVQAGQSLYPGQVCTACHGPDARGVEAVGPDLLDAEWLNTDGSYDQIVRTITEGVAEPQHFPGLMMPKGGNPALTDEQVRQLAAYIHATSQAASS
ncbi:MAG: cytochrome c [Gemmatimonadota bacterium]|jgi:mono/diheme cytochrome c family protein